LKREASVGVRCRVIKMIDHPPMAKACGSNPLYANSGTVFQLKP
jgi:hypothetical protein